MHMHAQKGEVAERRGLSREGDDRLLHGLDLSPPDRWAGIRGTRNCSFMKSGCPSGWRAPIRTLRRENAPVRGRICPLCDWTQHCTHEFIRKPMNV
jgi:hypothetical protein